MGAQLEHLKDVESILLKFSTPEFVSDYFKLKEIDRQKLLQHDNWDPSESLGKFTKQEKGFNNALGKTLSGITELEKEFGGNIVQKSFNYFNMAIKPMLEMEAIYGSFKRAYPDEKLTLEEFRPYHHFISTKYIDKLEQSMYEYVLKNFPEEAVKPKSPFKLKEGITESHLLEIYLRLKTKYTYSSAEAFIDFIIRPELDIKFNWTGTYEELWCFIQGMFTFILEMPLGLTADVIKWKDYTVDSSMLDKRKFSTWLNNKVLNSRITVKGGKFERDEMHVPQNSIAKFQDQLRKKLFKIVKG